VLNPTPIGGGFAGESGPGGEALEFVGVVVGFGEPVLVPHGIGDDPVEGAEFATLVAEFGVLEGVADLDPALHVVDDHVHIGHGPGVGDVFLAVELQRRGFFGLGPVFHGDLELHEEAAGAAAGVVDGHAGFGLEDAGHDGADLGRGVELAGALAAALSELADEILVALADDVGLDVIQAEALGTDGLDEVGEAVVVEVALAVGGGIEVDTVDDTLEKRIGLGDITHVGGDTFADPVCELADDGPDGLLWVVRHKGQVEANQLRVGLDEGECLLARADFFGDAVEFVVSLAPRMEQAASQIQDSRDLSFPFFVILANFYQSPITVSLPDTERVLVQNVGVNSRQAKWELIVTE
jgi:hypothetical protein